MMEVFFAKIVNGLNIFAKKIHHSFLMAFKYCVKTVRIRSISGLYFPRFGQNTEIYRVNFRIQSECEKIRTGKTPNTDTFYKALCSCIESVS